MKVRFWGVRGSFATPGGEYLRYGGNTPCIEVTAAGGARVLIDLGTGAAQLAAELMKGEFGKGRGVLPILLSHTHLDHIQGLPFFTPFFIKGNRIRIMGPEASELSLAGTLQNQLNPHYSPLYGLENLAAGVVIEAIGPGPRLPVAGFEVSAAVVPHGDMDVLAFRIAADGKSLAILGDVEYPDSGPTDDALRIARGVDLLVHDAMYTDEEYALRRGWGHSPVSAAVRVAEQAGAHRLALFHHSPDATDDEIDAVVAAVAAKTSIPVFAAAEGPEITL